MNLLWILVTYSAVALLVLWAIGEYGATPATKIVARWDRKPSLGVGVKQVLLPLLVAPLPVPRPVRALRPTPVVPQS